MILVIIKPSKDIFIDCYWDYFDGLNYLAETQKSTI